MTVLDGDRPDKKVTTHANTTQGRTALDSVMLVGRAMVSKAFTLQLLFPPS